MSRYCTMPRGKNYVNNNRGVSVQNSKKKGAPSMEQCFYAKGCTRDNCFYRHDGPAVGGGEKSTEPCMPFLAGLCTFSAGGCRKRHPNKAEAERLADKYTQMKCRYGSHCKTNGCLYIHGDDDGKGKLSGSAAFPPLAGSSAAPRVHMPPAGAWKPMQPTGASVVNPPPPRGPPAKSAWQPSPPPAPAPVWGQGRNPVLANHASPMNAINAPSMNPPAAVTPPVQQPTMTNSDSMLNINAKEFVPGGF